MSYRNLLNKLLFEKSYTQEELANKCTEAGTEITRSYINKLINTNQIPKEDITKAISKALDIDERLLLVEGYLDKAPKEIKEAFISLKKITVLCGTKIYENEFDETSLAEIMKKIEEEPISDFIILLIDTKNIVLDITKNGFELKNDNNIINCNYFEPIGLQVEDDAMFPFIQKENQVMLEVKETYRNGDIIAVTVKKNKKFIIRQAVFLGRQIELTAINKKYKPEVYKIEDISIMGKVNKIITKI